jgi:5'-AMP-activated protein kinase regulatory beta subunit
LDEFVTVVDLPHGKHQIKFIVDDEWRCSDNLKLSQDKDGNRVNELVIQDEKGDFQGDGLDGLADITQGRKC